MNLIDDYNILWHTPSQDSGGSMPLGNGDIALNVWVEEGGDLLFYIAKTDAWSGEGRLLKIGRVRVALDPNPFLAGQLFRQELVLREGEIRVVAGDGVRLSIWVDANHPTVQVQVASAEPLRLTANSEIWRTARRALRKPDEEHSAYGLHGTDQPVYVEADTVIKGQSGRVIWCHRNEGSIYRETLEHQHLGGWLERAPDPLLHRTFGAVMSGAGLENVDDTTLRSEGGQREFNLRITCHTAQTETLEEWTRQVTDRAAAGLDTSRAAHADWWHEFWERSYIHARGCPEALLASRGYALQRFVQACAGRGTYPIKFNGSLFTVDAKEPDWRCNFGPEFPQPVPGAADMGAGQSFDADYRRWGGPYWHQNTRLPYWSMLAAGDFDLMAAFFRLYLEVLPFAEFRTKEYFGHAGAFFAETMYFWGAYANSDYDYGRSPESTGKLSSSFYIRYHFQGAIEVLAAMLQFRNYGGGIDEADLLKFADAVLAFYAGHYPREADGTLRIEPAQALETFVDAVNPLPEVAGLSYVLDELLRLPGLNSERTKPWSELRAALPPIPIAVEDGVSRLAPAHQYGDKRNSENPELYAVFPYEQFSVGRPGLEMARLSFGLRQHRLAGGWSQDGIQAAMLGLTDLAAAYLVRNFGQTHPGSRFPAFWGPNYDWIPDNDHGSTAMIAMQRMLLQCVDGEPRLLPAWPRDWAVDFKLRAPGGLAVTCRYVPGQPIIVHQEIAA